MEKAVKPQRPRGGYLDALLESSPYAVIAIDGKGIITFVNRATTELTGYQTQELVGKTIITVYETEKHARETNRKLYLSGGIVHDHESVLKTKDGKLVPARISAAHLRDSSDNYIGAVGFFEAYRPWKAAETKMKEVCRELEAEIEEWRDLGAPIIEPLEGLAVVTIAGRLDGIRFERVRKKVVEYIRAEKISVVLMDLSGAVGGDVEVASQLIKTVRVVGLIGAKCVLAGIDSVMAQALEPVVADISLLNTFSSRKDAMIAAFAYLGYELVKKSDGGTLGQSIH